MLINELIKHKFVVKELRRTTVFWIFAAPANPLGRNKYTVIKARHTETKIARLFRYETSKNFYR